MTPDVTTQRIEALAKLLSTADGGGADPNTLSAIQFSAHELSAQLGFEVTDELLQLASKEVAARSFASAGEYSNRALSGTPPPKSSPLWISAKSLREQTAKGPLEQARKRGDASTDKLTADLISSGRGPLIGALARAIHHRQPIDWSKQPIELQTFGDNVAAMPPWADPAKMDKARAVFREHEPYIAVVLGAASLPYTYANPDIGQVLTATGKLTRSTAQRLADTMQFVRDVMEVDGLGKKGAGDRSIMRARIIHGVIRYRIENGGGAEPFDEIVLDPGERPINQEDMASVVLTFSNVIIHGLQRLGIELSPDEQDAYIHMWNVIGYKMGVESPLLPENVEAARDLHEIIRRRTEKESKGGFELTDATLDVFYDITSMERMTIAHVREVLGDDLSDLLGVPQSKHRKWVTGITRAVTRLGERFRPIQRFNNFFIQRLIDILAPKPKVLPSAEYDPQLDYGEVVIDEETGLSVGGSRCPYLAERSKNAAES